MPPSLGAAGLVALTGLIGLSGLSACLPSFEDRPWLVDDVRVLAIRSTPAEARPSQIVSYEALVVGPDGIAGTVSAWDYCVQPRTADERGAVTRACARGDALAPTPNPAMIPADACALFGPNPPPIQAGEPARRPADPDASGGYAIPVRALAAAVDLSGAEVAGFGKTRVRCDLAGATRPVFDAFEARYTSNQNPTIAGVVAAEADGGPTALGGEPPVVEPGQRLALRLTTGADAAEPYVLYVPERDELVDVRESLAVRWYVTDGELERSAETQAGVDAALAFTTTWVAPSQPGVARGWAVLNDDRGGTSWFAFEVTVP